MLKCLRIIDEMELTYPESQFSIPGYSVHRKGRKKGGGGVVALISSSLVRKSPVGGGGLPYGTDGDARRKF